MGIKIDQNCYFSAMKKEDLAINEQSIEQQAKSALHFHYGHVSYKFFSTEYFFSKDDEDRFDRKIKALPAGLWVLCETVYHMAIAIFIGIPKLLLGQAEYLQVHVFYLVRDGQELFGRVMSLFHDQYGLYYIQESQFQKSCYDCFLEEYSKAKVALLAVFQPNIPKRHFPLHKQPSQSNDIQTQKQDRVVKEDFRLVVKQIKQNTSDKKVKEKLLSALAEKLLANGDLDGAHEVIKEICSNTKLKDAFFAKLANKYYVAQNLDQAFEVAQDIRFDTQAKEALFILVLGAYHNLNREDKILNFITKIIISMLIEEAVKADYLTTDPKNWAKMKTHLDHFSNQLAQHCYGQIKAKAYKEKKDSTIAIIKNEVAQKKEQFLQLIK